METIRFLRCVTAADAIAAVTSVPPQKVQKKTTKYSWKDAVEHSTYQ